MTAPRGARLPLQHHDAALRRQRLVERPDDFVVEAFGTGDQLAERLAVDGGRIEVQPSPIRFIRAGRPPA